MSHQSPTYIKKTKISYIYLDLNHSIFWGEYAGKCVDIDTFLEDIIDMEIYGVQYENITPYKDVDTTYIASL